jgi:hypothetical protein
LFGSDPIMDTALQCVGLPKNKWVTSPLAGAWIKTAGLDRGIPPGLRTGKAIARKEETTYEQPAIRFAEGIACGACPADTWSILLAIRFD